MRRADVISRLSGREAPGALSTTRTFPVCVLLVIPGLHVLGNLVPAEQTGQSRAGDELWTTRPSAVDRRGETVWPLWMQPHSVR